MKSIERDLYANQVKKKKKAKLKYPISYFFFSSFVSTWKRIFNLT